ncbi:MAG: hypothetical protein QN132_04785 [Armatimonadota bacterium]|nr:hypothetical protein [Armatimonadota bacterium]
MLRPHFTVLLTCLVALLTLAATAWGSASYPHAVRTFTSAQPTNDNPGALIAELQQEVAAIQAALLNGLEHSLYPRAGAQYDLGRPGRPWREAHLQGGLVWDPLRAASGRGVLARMTGLYDVEIPDSTELSLVNLEFRNRNPRHASGSLFYGIRIITEADGIDGAAGIAVGNRGRGDYIYLDVAGKAGPAPRNSPTGIGIDLNRQGMGENSSTHSGYGIQIWDWSLTDGGANGPTALRLRKHRNANTGHLLLSLEGNRHLIRLSTPEGPQFDPAAPVVELRGANGASRWTVHAGGQQTFGPEVSLIFTLPGGPPASMRAADGYLEVRGGASGVRVVSGAGGPNSVLVQFSDGDLAADETVLLVRSRTGGTVTVKRVTLGPPDSCGQGYRCLRVTN